MAQCQTVGVGGVLLALLAPAGCSGADSDSPIDIGDKGSVAKEGLAAYAASWDGYAEAFQFEDKTDQVRLTLDDQGKGTLRFGQRALIPAVTDPAANYPPQYDPASGEVPGRSVWSGFAYSVQNTTLDLDRIRLTVFTAEIFSGYCAVQTPYLDQVNTSPPQYQCLPNLPSEGSNGTNSCYLWPSSDGADKIAVGCQQLEMCLGFCKCDATRCGVNPIYGLEVTLDGALQDAQQTLVGTLTLGAERIAVRLMRQ